MKTRIAFLTIGLLFCLFPVGVLHAQAEKIDPAFGLAKPFLKENTYLVAHVDLKALDLDAIAEKLKPSMYEGAKTGVQFGAKFQGKENDEAFLAEAQKQAEQAIDAQVEEYKMLVKSVVDAGVDGVFFFSMMETMQTFPVVMAIPGETEPEFDDRVTELLSSMGFAKSGFTDGMTYYVKGNALAAAGMPGAPAPATQAPAASPESFLPLLQRLKAKERKEINDALYLQRKSPVRLVFAPSLGMKGMAQMFLPAAMANLPEGVVVDQKAVTAIVKDFVCLSVGVDPRTWQTNIAAQFPSDESATAAETFFSGLAGDLEDEATQALVGEFLPKANKNRLILVIKEEQIKKLSAVGAQGGMPGGMSPVMEGQMPQ